MAHGGQALDSKHLMGGQGMPTDIYTEFLAVVDTLNDACIDYAVCGGIGLAIHGHPRFTRDIDFLIQAESWNKVRESLAGMKRLAGRPQDLADLAFLEGNHDG